MARQQKPKPWRIAVDTAADLTTLFDARMSDGDDCWVATVGVTHGKWCLDQTSALAVNGTTIVATLSGVGRWILFGAGGSSAASNVSVANEAALTALDVSAFNDGAIAYVQSHRSYWTLRTQALALVANENIASSAGAKQWTREVSVPHWSWTYTTTAWGIDTVNGNDENAGTVASPLQSFREWRRRNQFMSRDQTITVASGSAFNTADPFVFNPVDIQASGAAGFASTLTINGTRVLTAIANVATSTNVAGNVPATLDLGVALTVNGLVQATSGAQTGATAVIEYLIAGTNYATSQWRSAGGGAVAPPAPGDAVSSVALPLNSLMGLSHTHIAFVVTNFQFSAVDTEFNAYVELDTCIFPGFSVINPGIYQLNGCSISGSGTLSASQPGANITCNLCGTTRAVSSAIFGARIQLLNTIVAGAVATGVESKQGGGLLLSGVGIFKSTGQALDVHDGGECEIQGTLYGDATNAGKGTRVRDNGRARVQTNVVPTLTSTGQELELNNAATANAPPPLATGVIPIATALTTWAQWVAALFNRNAMSYFDGSIIATRA